MTPLVQNLLALTDAYTGHTGVSVNKVSKSLFNDGAGIRRLRDGGDLLTANYIRAVRWFHDNWPDGLAWPDDIDRPCADVSCSGGAPVDAAREGVSSLTAGGDLPATGTFEVE